MRAITSLDDSDISFSLKLDPTDSCEILSQKKRKKIKSSDEDSKNESCIYDKNKIEQIFIFRIYTFAFWKEKQ